MSDDALRLPLIETDVRFAVGDPTGLTSNSWRVWVDKSSEIYIACRDSFQEQKISLHSRRNWRGDEGNWRVGFTRESIEKGLVTLLPEQERQWEDWLEPPETLPGVVRAFELKFPRLSLALKPSDRISSKWKKNKIFIEAGKDDLHTFISLCINRSASFPDWEGERTVPLGIWKLFDGRYCQLIARTSFQPDLSEWIGQYVNHACEQAISDGLELTGDEFLYFHGHEPDGCRFFVGAPVSFRCFDEG